MSISKKEIIVIGKLTREIIELMEAGKEEPAYDKLNDLNSKLSDIGGKVLEMEEVLSMTK